MIEFNVPIYIGTEEDYIKDTIKVRQKISGDGYYTKECNLWLENNLNAKKAMLTTSCTHALEMTAVLSDISEGDEVIMPSYTYVSSANAFALRKAKIVFVDINPLTMNIDETLIEEAVTDRTKAIVVVHYGGVACEMDSILQIAKKHNLFVIEDAAQGVMATYRDKCLGTIGDFGCFSFHETKNYSMGEGGAIIINTTEYESKAEIIREEGTNKSLFTKGMADKYTWMDLGSSYQPSEINAAYLYPQLLSADIINNNRLETWNLYNSILTDLADGGVIQLPFVPSYAKHNAHTFYIKCNDFDERSQLIDYLREQSIQAVFHYIPLHSSPYGRENTRFCGEDRYTTKESERLLRLPLYYNMKENDVMLVCEKVKAFYNRKS